MIKVELMVTNKHIKTFSYATQICFKEVLKDVDLSVHHIVAFKKDNEYINVDLMIDKDAKIIAIPFSSEEGYRIYQDSIIFLMTKAFYNVFPVSDRIVVEHSIGDGIYCEIAGTVDISEAQLNALKHEMKRIVNENLDITKQTVRTLDAEQIFANRPDILCNLEFWNRRTVHYYQCGKYTDYFVRQLAYSTSVLDEFSLIHMHPGLILRFPTRESKKINHGFTVPQKLFTTHQEHDKWLTILKVQNISDLNRLIESYMIMEFIQIEEALHEKKIALIADKIAQNPECKVVLIAGPSSSGKTTFAKRLSIQFQVTGLVPIVIGLDDYFLSRAETPKKSNGDYDFENIDALDLPLLNKHLQLLLSGEEVELPKYNFLEGVSESSHQKLRMSEKNVLIMEGIHGLNDKLTASIPSQNKVKIYVSALNQLNIDRHNRIPTTDCRKLRRITRDYRYRGYSAEDTLNRWGAVREGEDKNIFPYQENADFFFNSSLTYEIAVLKKHIMPLLVNISRYSPLYQEAKQLMQLLDHFLDIPDDHVPPNSILREFTYGSVFKY